MRIRSIVIAALILFTTTGLLCAQDVTISGSIGGTVMILQTFGIALHSDVTFTSGNLKLGASTDFDIYPTLGGNGRLWTEYSLERITLGGEVYFGILPPSFDSMDVYAKADLFSIASDDSSLSFSGQVKLWVGIYPSFTSTLTTTLSLAVGPVSAKSTTIIDLLPFGLSSQDLSFETAFLDTTIGDNGPSLNGKLGGDFPIYPSFSGTVWVSMTAGLNGVTFTSKTTFAVLPFGFSSQYVKMDFKLEPFEFYLSATFTTTDPQVEAGLSYSFP